MPLKEQLKRKEQEVLFGEYERIAYGIISLRGIIQNPMVHSKEDVEAWLKEVARVKIELNKLIEATVKSVGFILAK